LVLGLVGLLSLLSVGNFGKFRTELPVVVLPAQYSCWSGDHRNGEDDLKYRLWKKYRPKEDAEMHVFGRLDYFGKNKNTYVIFSVVGRDLSPDHTQDQSPDQLRVPWLYTYSDHGVILDSLCLQCERCYASETRRVWMSTVIQPDMSILIKDSSTTDLPFDEKRIVTTTVVHSVRYALNSKGIHRRLADKRDTLRTFR
jgi:hypothetical protein